MRDLELNSRRTGYGSLNQWSIRANGSQQKSYSQIGQPTAGWDAGPMS